MSRVEGTSKAFTVVELLIVIVVIGILAAITVVGYLAVVNNANDKSVQSDISKLADSVKLLGLDNNNIPDGGATSSSTGDPTVLSGISFKPNISSYDQTVANLYYCSGIINGTKEFSIIARSKSGNAYSYSSKSGVSNFSGYTWTSSNNGVALCGVAGYAAPFNWSYGYNPAVNYGWFAWAFNGSVITNLITNPNFGSGSTIGYGDNSSNGTGSIALSVDRAHIGTQSLKVVAGGTAANNGVYMAVNSPTAGTYTFSAWVYIPSTGGFTTLIAAVGSSVFTSGPVITARDQWVRVSITAPLSVGTSTWYFYDYGGAGSESTGNVFYVNQTMQTQGPTLYNYADGNTPRWLWTGTTNNSTSTGPAL